MRRLATLLVPVLALSACYPGYRSGPDSYRYDADRWYDAADVPLAARVEQVGSGLGIRLNRPAYVAMFEIIPGQGVGLYYPAYGAERGFFPSGFSSLPLHGARYYDSYFTGMPARYSRGEPRFYFLVASRRPLRSITRFQRADGAIRSVLGLTAYNTINYRRVMDDLVEAVVPMQDDADWTTDVLAVWPQDYGYYAYNDGYQRVYCGDGTTELLPVELALWGCRRQQRPIVVRAPRTADGGTTPPPAPGDSVRAPTRHRPQPADGADTGADATGRPAMPQRRPGTPEAAEPATPRARPGVDGETSTVPGEGDGDARAPRVEPRERPRGDTPRPEPRETPRTEPRTESPRPTPRSESPRTEPRAESPRPAPRAETPRSEPRSEAPRPAPVRNDPPPRAEPAQSSAPAPAARSERPVPAPAQP